MHGKVRECLWLMVGLTLIVSLALGGCTKMKRMVGLEKPDEEEESFPAEAKEEAMMVDGKPYVRSKNPYWLIIPDQPEYVYVEKGKEYVGIQRHFIDTIAKAVRRDQAKAAGKTVPPDKLQEMVRAEVDRILREQGLGGLMAQSKPGGVPVTGRAVAVIPYPDTPRAYEGLNRTLATTLADNLGRQKDIKVSTPERVREAMSKAGVAGRTTLRPNIVALGDFLGVQGIIFTGVVPPEKGGGGFMVLEVYDTFQGNKAQSIVEPAGATGLKPEAATKFVQQASLRVAAEMLNMDWFGRVEFVKEGKVYLSLGQNAGLKVGDKLKVVAPGKEVINPQTKASLGYGPDTPQGELKVTELLSNTGAVATTMSGGPFKPNDKVKMR